ncbi:MAG: agmatine deiminase family protein [Bacteroidota bacterium]|nr:agmatine deiminase family protein [Bacteroidota bacterium]
MKKLIFTLFTFVICSNLLQAQTDVPLYKRSHFLSEEEMKSHDPTRASREFYPTDPPAGSVRQVAEFERMQSILIRYPFGIPMTMIAEISEDCGVTTLVLNQLQENTVRNQYIANGVNIDNCDFVHAPTDSHWTRDYGPWYITHGQNEIGIVNFPYNRPARPNDDDVPIVMANELGIDLYGMELIHTGGNYMTDGLGVGASTTLVYTENPDLTPEDVDTLVEEYLGIHTYHLLPDPLGDYIEHIDCWGKFLDVDKVLIGQVSTSDPRYEDFEYVADYFANEISSYGNHYQVYRVQTPGQSQVTPYTNSLIMNDKVLVPQTGNQLDDDALEVYEEAMPGYEIIGIYYNEWYNTDAIHCRAHGTVDQGLLYIKHFPLLGEVPYADSYQVSATITPFSGEALYPDSLLLYYRTGNNPFSKITMTNVFGYQYRASIPAQEMGSEISYYIFAADESGRREKHPFIGSADPHVFTIGPPENPDVNLNPDSLIYMNVQQCDTGLIAYVRNNNPVPVEVVYLPEFGQASNFQWIIDPYVIELPYSIPPFDSLALRIKVALPVSNNPGLVVGTHPVGTMVDTHNIYICVDESLVGTKEIKTESFRAQIYPNPVRDALNLRFSKLTEGELRVQLIDLQGRILAEHAENLEGKDEKILSLDSQVQSLKEGIYFIRIMNGGEQLTRKFVRLQ